jgi:ribulose-phosphate 3-epimerase
MTEIIPAILSPSFDELRSSLARLRAFSSYAHIDICDGVFVRNVTWPYSDPGAFENISSGDEGMPFWKDIQFEVDLMVDGPEEVLREWINAGVSRIIIHNRSTTKMKDILSRLEDAGVEAGVALGVDEGSTALDAYHEKISFAQCMGIVDIGEQGNTLDERVMDTVRAIRTRFPNLAVSVDGGVRLETVQALSQVGAHRLIVGSAIMRADDPRAMYEKLIGLTRL